MDANVHKFNSAGYISCKLSDQVVSPIWKEVREIQADFEKATPYNNKLAGNIEHEYELTKCAESTFELIAPFVKSMDDMFNIVGNYRVLNKPCPYMLEGLWVNFQKKHEFNPVHTHSGVYSFVLWLKVPYKMEDETARIASRNSRISIPAHFQFSYIDSLGSIRQDLIPVDETYENTLVIFPAKLNHQVYPFYTSDEYRISVSGNICLRVEE